LKLCPKALPKKEPALAKPRAIVHRAVLDREGVDDDAGNAVPVSIEGIDALADIRPVF